MSLLTALTINISLLILSSKSCRVVAAGRILLPLNQPSRNFLNFRGGAFHTSSGDSYHSLSNYKAESNFSSTSRRRASIFAMTSNPDKSTSSAAITPPKPHRDENQKAYAGNDPNTNFIRQSQDSVNALVDPPAPIPNPYGWMRDESRTNTDVLNHLKLENEYTSALTQHLQPLRTKLYEEMKGMIQETDYTVPVLRGEHYLYYSRTFEGKSYNVHCRAPKQDISQIQWDGSAEEPILPGEEVYLDTNKIAEGHGYCSTGNVKMSPSHTKVAYTLDVVGGETYKLLIKDVTSGEISYKNNDEDMDSRVVWGIDDSTIFYSKMDEAHRPFQVYRKSLVNSEPDVLLFEELDELYWVGISKSQDDQYIFISSESKETSEVHYISLSSESAEMHVVAPRQFKVKYDVEHHCNQFYIMSNIGGTPNMRLLASPVQPNSQELWEDVVFKSSSEEPVTLFDGGYERSLDSLTPFNNHLVVQGREMGLPRIWILSLRDHIVTSFDLLEFMEEAHDVGLGANYIYDTDKVLVSYNSLVTPLQTIQIPLDDPNNAKNRAILKRKNVPGYNPNLYACERTTVLSRDGQTSIPVSIVYRKDALSSDGPVPTHLYGYGSYGHSVESDFSIRRLPLLDRGMVYVIAHVRGGGEMGRQWYEEPNGGKYLCKMNTFQDFVDVAEWLVSNSGKGITKPEMLSCEGRSAGGLLIGASINLAPELFRAAILGVPFVDVACTMIDSTIPLTVVEWEEWGNPNEEKFKEYILGYSPMENVKEGAVYPACLLTGGLHDPRVQYWEPSKFAATLRHFQSQESGPVCVKIDMTAGHFSASDRYKYLKELSFDYAFLLDQLGLADE